MGMPRKLLAWLMVPVICLFALVLYVARPFNPDNNRLLARTIARVGRLLLGMERPLEGADNMPQDRPGSLSAEEYAAIVAYFLQLNGRQAGDSELPADAELLGRRRW